jgi:hypothetical protein
MSASVLPLNPPEVDQCGVCDKPNTKLVFVDRTTLIKVGLCCVQALRHADSYLTHLGPMSGARHPDPFPI